MSDAVGNYETRSSPSQITWLGLSSVYTTDERGFMSQLSVQEQTILHVLKALTDGEISAAEGLGTQSGGAEAEQAPVYTAPEDITFGSVEPSRQRVKKTYALVWTWRKSRVFKTKVKASAKLRVWRKWYERQGWKLTKHEAGYFATGPAGERHAISLHEYDQATNERLA